MAWDKIKRMLGRKKENVPHIPNLSRIEAADNPWRVRVLDVGPVTLTKPAKQSDWKNEPMPTSSKALTFSAIYALEEFQRIILGLIPEDMDDKWFIYYDEPWLYLHRSWTGYCIYKVRFQEHPSGFQAVEALVNCEPSQYKAKDDEAEGRLLKILLDSRGQRDVRQQMIEHIRKLNQ